MGFTGTRNDDFAYMQQVSSESKASAGAISEAKENLLISKRNEIKSLHNMYNELYKTYGMKKPSDLNKATLQQVAREIRNQWSSVEAKLMVMLKYDVTTINHFVIQKEKSQFMKIKNKQVKIKQELLDVMHYWDYLSSKGRMPGLFHALHKYNKKPIAHPFKHLEEEEAYLLRKIIKRV